jgi:hypothetical protein
MSAAITKQVSGERRAYDVNGFCASYGIGRTKFYEEKKSGRLKVKHVGKRMIITADDAEDWLKNLPAA